MVQPSPTWSTRRVYITYRNALTRTMEPGSWTATATARITNTLADGTHQVFRAGAIGSGTLNTSEGVPSLDFDLPVVDDPDNLPQGGEIVLKVTFNGGGSETFHLSPLSTWPLEGTDLALILDPDVVAGAPPYAIIGVPGGVAKLDEAGNVLDGSGQIVSGGGGGTGGPIASTSITDSTVLGRTLITATDQASARTAIGAGTSSLAIGTTSTTAKAGNYAPTAGDVSDATTVGRNVLKAADATAARTAIGAGTSNLALGTTPTTAKAGDYTPTQAQVYAVAPDPVIAWDPAAGAWSGPVRATWPTSVIVKYKASRYQEASMPSGAYQMAANDELYLNSNSSIWALVT